MAKNNTIKITREIALDEISYEVASAGGDVIEQFYGAVDADYLAKLVYIAMLDKQLAFNSDPATMKGQRRIKPALSGLALCVAKGMTKDQIGEEHIRQVREWFISRGEFPPRLIEFGSDSKDKKKS